MAVRREKGGEVVKWGSSKRQKLMIQAKMEEKSLERAKMAEDRERLQQTTLLFVSNDSCLLFVLPV
jgi:hypothetical protein